MKFVHLSVQKSFHTDTCKLTELFEVLILGNCAGHGQLKNLLNKISKAGYLIVDVYDNLPACHQAVTDFRSEYSIKNVIKQVDWTAIYQRV